MVGQSEQGAARTEAHKDFRSGGACVLGSYAFRHWRTPEGRARAELLARAGARVVGEHLHPGCVERFTVVDGELSVRLDGATSVLAEGESAEVSPGNWHDWWNAMDRDIRVVVEVTPGTVSST